MTALLANIHLALPEIIILVTACITLMSELLLKKYSDVLTFSLANTGLILAAAVSLLFLGQYQTLLFRGLFISDDLAQLMNLFICLIVALSFAYSRVYLAERKMPAGDYYVLGLFSVLGMMILVSAHSLLTIYLGLELLSLPLYAMVAIRRTDSNASEAALKYFVMGAIASGMLLYGISLIYGATGALDLQVIKQTIVLHSGYSGMLAFALVFVIAGIGFKLALVPFHMWAPDVYTGAPTSVTLLISTAPKIAAMGMAFRFLVFGLGTLAAEWQQLILIMALLSVIVGNLFAIVQDNIKRLLAYSAISHMGYALFGILAATPSGYAYALYYVLVYAITTAAAFGLIALMSRSGYEIEQVKDLNGLNRRNPWLAFMMMIVMFSMAGVPPTVGFFIKLLVLKSLVDVHMAWVAILGLIFAAVGAFYYIRVVKVMYFDDAVSSDAVILPRGITLLFSANCLALLYFGIFPNSLIQACVSVFAS